MGEGGDNFVINDYLLNNGVSSPEAGNIVATSCWNRTSVKTFVITNEIFSPDSGGRKKTSKFIIDSKIHGRMTLRAKKLASVLSNSRVNLT